MNKAFVKEPEQTDAALLPRLPVAGYARHGGDSRRELRSESRSKLGTTAYFCPFSTCEIVYFDAFDRSATTADCLAPVYPKHADAPICACHGFTVDEIDADVDERGVARTRAAVARAKATDRARCESCSPWGQSCVGEIQRYYMRRSQQQG